MVVLAATNCAVENDGVRELLAGYRHRRMTLLLERVDVCIRTQFALVDGASALRSEALIAIAAAVFVHP
jgi:hypothetical protein